jgi:hypothetical protein
MNLKSAIAASAVFVGMFTLVGCGGDECTQASDQLTSCKIMPANTSASAPAAEVTCTGATLCSATCTNNATCAELMNAFIGPQTSVSTRYLECVAKCGPTK